MIFDLADSVMLFVVDRADGIFCSLDGSANVGSDCSRPCGVSHERRGSVESMVIRVRRALLAGDTMLSDWVFYAEVWCGK